MSNTQTNIDVKVMVKAVKARKELDKIQRKMAAMEKKVQSFNKPINKFGRNVVKTMNKSSQEVVKFNGNMLSLLFFGMQLQKVFTGALKSIFEGYKKIIPESSAFNRMTTQLSANWQFFKFQLADALAKSPLFQKFVMFAINLLRAFQKLPEPMKKFITFALIAGAIIGGLLFFIGFMTLGIAGLINVMGSLTATAAGTTTGLGLLAGKALFFAAAALLIAAAIGVVSKGLELLHDNSDVAKKKWDGLKSAWVDIIGNAVEPLMKGISKIGISLNDMNEVLIVVGAVFHNVFARIGMLVNATIPMFRTLFNVLQIGLEAIVAFAKVFDKAMRGDFSGAKSAMRDFRDDTLKNFNDITDAWRRSQNTFNDLNASVISGQEISDALNNYRATLDVAGVNTEQQSQDAAPKTTNIILGGINEALDTGVIDAEIFDEIDSLSNGIN